MGRNTDQHDAALTAEPPHAGKPGAPARPSPADFLRLARPVQWSKSLFVLVGPFYGLPDALAKGAPVWPLVTVAVIAAVCFSLVSSACYVVNDIFDRESDRAHPRKKSRPIAAGRISIGTAWAFAVVLLAAGLAGVLFIPAEHRVWVGVCLLLYAANVSLYSAWLKHKVIADVMSLSLGFVLRVMAGCAAVGIEPSVWLLNVTFFLSMFLAFGKRLGERRMLSSDSPATKGETHAAVRHRRVQAGYTDALLQMAVVVTAVITLMTYALYVKEQGERYVLGFNLLWLTMLPATYGLLRAIVKLEHGEYDDPTELAMRDRGMQAAGLLFVVLTVALMWGIRGPE